MMTDIGILQNQAVDSGVLNNSLEVVKSKISAIAEREVMESLNYWKVD